MCSGINAPRLPTNHDIPRLSLQLVSQDSAQELLKYTISPYLGVSRIEFQFCCLSIRFVSQGVVCFQLFIVLSLEVTPRITSMFHVFSSIIHSKAPKCLQGYTRSKSSHTFSFNQYPKTVHMNSLNTPFHHFALPRCFTD